MSILDVLLETDVEKFNIKTSKEYEVKRLSEKLGSKFVVTCTPLKMEQLSHISEISKNTTEMKLNAVLECCRIEGEKFGNQTLMDKLKAHTPREVVEKLFLPGEVFKIYEVINEMSGYGEKALEEIKN